MIIDNNNIDGRIRLVLGRAAPINPTMYQSIQFPQCLLFTKADMDTKRPLIVFTDTGVRMIMMERITEAC